MFAFFGQVTGQIAWSAIQLKSMSKKTKMLYVLLLILLAVVSGCFAKGAEFPDSGMMLTDIARMEKENQAPQFKASAIENEDLLFTIEPSGLFEGS